MKKLISILLLLSLAFSFSSCTRWESKTDVSCEDIIVAYKKAGYTLGHHLHEDPVYVEDGICCSLLFEDPENPDKNYIYIERHYTMDGAWRANKDSSHNLILWFVFALNGEARWLHSGRFGEIHYVTFEAKMIKPLREIMK